MLLTISWFSGQLIFIANGRKTTINQRDGLDRWLSNSNPISWATGARSGAAKLFLRRVWSQHKHTLPFRRLHPPLNSPKTHPFICRLTPPLSLPLENCTHTYTRSETKDRLVDDQFSVRPTPSVSVCSCVTLEKPSPALRPVMVVDELRRMNTFDTQIRARQGHQGSHHPIANAVAYQKPKAPVSRALP